MADLQWGMEMIHATTEGSYAVQPGRPEVLVGIIDTGIDSTHPDLDDNVDTALSRNFTTDIPLIDGPCNQEPDRFLLGPGDSRRRGARYARGRHRRGRAQRARGHGRGA